MISAARPALAIETSLRSAHWLSGEAALQRAGRECIEHLLRHETAGRAGDPEGIHQMRVAVRRLRAILSGFAPLLPAEPRRRAADQLRWLAGTLGEARNLDVLALDIIAPACAVLPPATGLERLAEVIERHRHYAHAEVEAAINSDRYAASVRQVTHWFDEKGWHSHKDIGPLGRPVGELAPMLLERRYRLVKKRSKDFTGQSEAQRHQLRIVLKKMRYTGELLADLYDQAASKRFIQCIKRLQDDLGYRNDVSVARETMKELTRPKPRDLDLVKAGRRVLAWHKQRLAGNEGDARRHLRKLFETPPFWSYINLRPA